MIKVSLFGKNSNSIRHFLPQFDLEISEDNPDVIISYGGDGTLLSAERKFPGIPKLPIRDSIVCKKCSEHKTETLLKDLSGGKIDLKIFPKLQAKFGEEDILAINDIVVRNSTPMHALRFKVFKNNATITPEIIIGDGTVAATPFGSTGYYQSITRKTIDERSSLVDRGFALAFNNTTVNIEPIHFSKNDKIKIIIVRGPGSLSSDNNPKLLSLREADEITIFPSTHHAKIYVKTTLRCEKCVILRDKRLDS